MVTLEDAYQAYNRVRSDFPSFANFEGCPWVEADPGAIWTRSNKGYVLRVTTTGVRVDGPDWSQAWSRC